MNKTREYSYFLGLFFLIFSPHILVFGVTVKTVYVFIVVPGIMGMYVYFKNPSRNIIEKSMLSFMLLGLIYFVLISGINFFNDTSVIKQILMGLIIFFACFYFVHHYYKMYGDRFVTRLFMDLNKVGIIHSIIILATFWSTGFRDFLYSFIGLTELATHYAFGYGADERYSGLAHSGFAFLSTTHALLLIAGIWGFYMSNKNYRWSEIILLALGQITIFISIMLIGRTGFVVIIVFLSALIILRVFHFMKDPRLSEKTIRLFFVFCVLLLTTLFTVDFSKYTRNINYAFETVIKYAESGELDASTTDVLENQFIFPDTTFDMLFGTGNFGRSDKLPFIYSDVGYVLFIFGGGIFGMLIGYSFYFMGFYYSYKYRRLTPYLSAFIAVYFFVLIIVNLKDYYHVSYSGYCQIYFIAICALGKCVKYRNNINMNISATRDYARTS